MSKISNWIGLEQVGQDSSGCQREARGCCQVWTESLCRSHKVSIKGFSNVLCLYDNPIISSNYVPPNNKIPFVRTFNTVEFTVRCKIQWYKFIINHVFIGEKLEITNTSIDNKNCNIIPLSEMSELTINTNVSL